MQSRPITLVRRVAQFVFFGLLGKWLYMGVFRCPFGVPFVNCYECPLTDCPGRYLQIPVLAGLVLSGLLAGRVFCGWACPMGLIEDALARLPKAKGLVSKRFTSVDRRLKWLRWVMLVPFALIIWMLNFPPQRAYDFVVRGQAWLNLDPLKLALMLDERGHFIGRIAFFAALVLISLVIPRFWCRYLCPVGALLGLFNKVSWLKVRRNEAKCSHCDLYPAECIMHTTPGKSDCIVCGECVQGCPMKAITFGPPKSKEETQDESEATSA